MPEESGDQTPEPGRPAPELIARVVALRDGGAAWSQIQHEVGLSRQQVRYAYQLGKRAARKREGTSE